MTSPLSTGQALRSWCRMQKQISSLNQLSSEAFALSWATFTESSIHEPTHACTHVILGYPGCRTGISTSWVKLESRQQHLRCGYRSQRLHCTQITSFSWWKRGTGVSYPHTLECRQWGRSSGFAQKSCPENRNAFLRGAGQRVERFNEHQSREKGWQGICVLPEACASAFLHWEQED